MKLPHEQIFWQELWLLGDPHWKNPFIRTAPHGKEQEEEKEEEEEQEAEET